MRVMQVKHNQRVKMNQVNSRQLFALNYSNTGQITGTCCGFGQDKHIPSHQQGYGNYNRRALNGLGGGGLASRVQNGDIGTPEYAMNTQKRVPDFTNNEYIANKRSVALRCQYSSFDPNESDNCKKPVVPVCYNSSDGNRSSRAYPSRGGNGGTITQDLGYLSSGQQINKQLSLRAGHTTTAFNEFENPTMNNPPC